MEQLIVQRSSKSFGSYQKSSISRSRHFITFSQFILSKVNSSLASDKISGNSEKIFTILREIAEKREQIVYSFKKSKKVGAMQKMGMGMGGGSPS